MSKGSELTRRQAVAGLAALGVLGCRPSDAEPDRETADSDETADTASEACPDRTSAQVEGPFYPGEPPDRLDIRGDRDGVVIDLDLEVVAQGDCAPIADAEVDVWSADAAGDYSGYAQLGTEGEDWLRGQQRTDSQGKASFRAVVPGAYPGRAVHFHVKVRAPGRPELTTQVYLPDAVVAAVLQQAAYADSGAQVDNADDGIYREDTLLAATGDVASGYSASGTLVV